MVLHIYINSQKEILSTWDEIFFNELGHLKTKTLSFTYIRQLHTCIIHVWSCSTDLGLYGSSPIGVDHMGGGGQLAQKTPMLAGGGGCSLGPLCVRRGGGGGA